MGAIILTAAKIDEGRMPDYGSVNRSPPLGIVRNKIALTAIKGQGFGPTFIDFSDAKIRFVFHYAANNFKLLYILVIVSLLGSISRVRIGDTKLLVDPLKERCKVTCDVVVTFSRFDVTLYFFLMI